MVLCAPAINLLRHHLGQDAELHFLTKAAFAPLLAPNPKLSRIHSLKADLSETIRELRAENFDYVLDLHQSLRSLRVLLALRKPFSVFDKLSFRRWLFTRFRLRHLLISHVCERYTEAAKKCLQYLHIPLQADFVAELDFFLSEAAEVRAEQLDFPFEGSYAVVLGATHATKKWLPAYFLETINRLGLPVVLLGGKAERKEAEEIIAGIKVPFFDAVGGFDLQTSAAMLSRTRFVLTHDTGFMHIAAAFRKPVFALWGSTAPSLGFAPYQTQHIPLELADLACHPCSKMGTANCPQGHFNCMRQLSPELVVSALQAYLNKP